MFGRGVLDSNIRNIPLSSQKKSRFSSSNLWDFFSLIWDFFAVLCQAFALSRSVPSLHLTRIARTGLGTRLPWNEVGYCWTGSSLQPRLMMSFAFRDSSPQYHASSRPIPRMRNYGLLTQYNLVPMRPPSSRPLAKGSFLWEDPGQDF